MDETAPDSDEARRVRPVEVQCVPMAGGTACSYSAPCPGGASPNEDAVVLVRLGEAAGVLAVADGLGGGVAGEKASALALAALQEAVKAGVATGQPLRAAILNGIEAANEAVLALRTGAATTLAVAELADGFVRPYHVGDSAILLTGQRGKTKLQTLCHSPVGFAVEAGQLDEAEAMRHEDRHIVSNVVGMPDMRVEVGSAIRLAVRDTLLLATDGLFDNLYVHEVIAVIRKGRLEDVARALAGEARRRMLAPAEDRTPKPDDLTFVAFRPGRQEAKT